MTSTNLRTAALVLAAAGWAAAFSGTKAALGGFGAVTLLAVELVAAAAVLWAVVLIRRRCALVPWRHALALGLLEPGVAYLGDTVGLQHTSAANASVISGLEAAFVVVLAAVFLRERITPALSIAVIVGLAGLVVLEGGGAVGGPGVGDALVLGGALSAAAYTVVARRVGLGDVEEGSGGGHDVDWVAMTAQQFLVAALAVLPAVAVAWLTGAEGAPRHVPARTWSIAAGVGVLGFAMSFLLYNWAIARVEARTAAVVLNLIPVFGLVLAVGWLGERPSAQRLAGAALITASVAVFAWLELRRAPDPPASEQLERFPARAYENAPRPAGGVPPEPSLAVPARHRR